MSSAACHVVIFSLYIHQIQYIFPQQPHGGTTVTFHFLLLATEDLKSYECCQGVKKLAAYLLFKLNLIHRVTI